MSRPVCGMCMCLIDETGCGCNGQAEELMEIMESNNEPVAWLLFRDGGESYPEYTTSYKQMREWETYLGDNERIEPHYTHPAETITLAELRQTDLYRKEQTRHLRELLEPKTLTDEEIGQIWKECMESPYMQVSNPVGFARAILKKAQEK